MELKDLFKDLWKVSIPSDILNFIKNRNGSDYDSIEITYETIHIDDTDTDIY